mgnify:CR=1 FL=1
MRCVVFFFQAEDGIRDLVRSRGLGDVYKRQGMPIPDDAQVAPVPDQRTPAEDGDFHSWLTSYCPVSYTHLTLPTSDLV